MINARQEEKKVVDAHIIRVANASFVFRKRLRHICTACMTERFGDFSLLAAITETPVMTKCLS